MGVFVEGLVEVAEAEEDEDVRVLLFYAEVLSPDRCSAQEGLLADHFTEGARWRKGLSVRLGLDLL